MKKIIQISLFTLTVIGLLTLTGFIINGNMLKNVAGIEVVIYRNAESGFISREEIMSTLNKIDSLTDRLTSENKLELNKIETDKIERVLYENPYIEEVDSYLTLDGKLLINIKEKEPIIRVYDKGKGGFYIDNQGDIFPVSGQYSPRVIIANGYINEKANTVNSNISDTIYDNTVFRELFYLTKLINQNSLLVAQINQIYVNSKGEYDLIPELGDHLVQLGTMEDIQNKLQNLEAYYRKNMKSNDWDKYKIINLIYKDQIVCTKK